MHVCFASQLWNKLHRFVALITVIAHSDSYENNGIQMLCFSKINLTGRKLSDDDELINLVKQASDLIHS